MRMNKWIVLGVLVGLLVTGLATGCNSGSNTPAAPSQIILKAADIQPEDYPTTMAMKYMAKLLDERSKRPHQDAGVWRGAVGSGKRND